MDMMKNLQLRQSHTFAAWQHKRADHWSAVRSVSNVIVVIATLALAAHVSAEPTATERLIIKDVIARGGDVEFLHTPRLLGLFGGKFSAEDIDYVRHLPGLSWLVARNIQLDDQHSPAYMYHHDGLRYVDLTKCAVSASFARAMVTCGNLRKVHLTSGAISADALRVLANAKQVEVLTIEDIAISDEMLTSLQLFRHLKQLDIFDSGRDADDENKALAANDLKEALRNSLPETKINVF